MLLLLSLLGCAGADDGTWMFTLAYTADVGDECATTVTHNFLSAYTPAAATPDLSWSETTSNDYSPQVFFGRIESTADGAALIVGTDVYPGTAGKGGAWTFAWDADTNGEEQYTHVTGYSFLHDYENEQGVRIEGTIKGGDFTGDWTTTTTNTNAYTESDTWSDEAAAYVGTGGLTPASSYLLKLDATGTEVAASNAQSTYDCSSSSCTLTVQQGCAYSYDLTAVRTDFTGDDEGWTSDAGQPAGAP